LTKCSKFQQGTMSGKEIEFLTKGSSRWKKLETVLSEFKFPTLLIKGSPGAVIPESRAKWLQEKIPHLVVKDIGPGIHYLQEDNPEGIGNSILEWISKIT